MRPLTITIPAERVEAYERAHARWLANPRDMEALEEMRNAAHVIATLVSLAAEVACATGKERAA